MVDDAVHSTYAYYLVITRAGGDINFVIKVVDAVSLSTAEYLVVTPTGDDPAASLNAVKVFVIVDAIVIADDFVVALTGSNGCKVENAVIILAEAFDYVATDASVDIAVVHNAGFNLNAFAYDFVVAFTGE